MTAGAAATLKRALAVAASGGLTAAGAASTSLVSAGLYTHTASGGLTAAGTAILKRALALAASGGLTTAGAATFRRTLALAASGGLTAGGGAIAAKTALFSHTASGGATLGGTASLQRVAAHLASGGITFGGAAGIAYQGALVYSHTASGGLTSGGIATLKRVATPLADGGITFGGTAAARLVATSSASAVEVALEILDNQLLEPGITVRQGLRLILAALAGQVAGAETDIVTIRNAGDTVTRITAHVDQHGNRLAVSYDMSDG